MTARGGRSVQPGGSDDASNRRPCRRFRPRASARRTAAAHLCRAAEHGRVLRNAPPRCTGRVRWASWPPSPSTFRTIPIQLPPCRSRGPGGPCWLSWQWRSHFSASPWCPTSARSSAAWAVAGEPRTPTDRLLCTYVIRRSPWRSDRRAVGSSRWHRCSTPWPCWPARSGWG